MNDTTLKLIESVGVVAVIFLIRWGLLHAIHRYIDDTEMWFRARRFATYLATAIAAVTLAWIWLDAFESLPTYLGLVSAGIAIALSDVLKNMAGWFYIISRRPLRLGDRIEVAGTSGDVVDIRLFRFSLMEIGNWVHADQSTGRLVHVPNGVVFTNPVANYTEGFEYVWHEIPVLVTFESDWRGAKETIREIVDDVALRVDDQARQHLRATARAYQIRIGTLTPIVYLTVEESGVLLTARFLVDVKNRRTVDEHVWEAILEAFDANPAIELAYPTVRSFIQGPLTFQAVESSSNPEDRKA